MPREIELFFDVGSSYSYLAATQMAGLTERTGIPVRWRPFNDRISLLERHLARLAP